MPEAKVNPGRLHFDAQVSGLFACLKAVAVQALAGRLPRICLMPVGSRQRFTQRVRTMVDGLSA